MYIILENNYLLTKVLLLPFQNLSKRINRLSKRILRVDFRVFTYKSNRWCSLKAQQTGIETTGVRRTKCRFCNLTLLTYVNFKNNINQYIHLYTEFLSSR